MVKGTESSIVLVTGAAGFIGSHLCRRLIKDGYRVVGVDNLNLSYSPKMKLNHIKDLLDNRSFDFVVGDISQKSFLNNLFKKYSINIIVHLAARAGVRESIEKPLWFKESNISGTVNLLELAKQYNIDNYIFASSSSVYGESKAIPFKEDQNTDYPVSPYSATKKAGELFSYTYSYLVDVPVTILRFFNVYGPGMRPTLAMPLFAKGIEEGSPIIQFGDGTMARSYTYIDDIVEGVMRAIKKPSQYRVLNLGGEEVISLKNLISTLEDIYGKKTIKNILPKPTGDVSITYADNSKAKEYLNWKPMVSFRQGTENFVKWYRANKDRLKDDIYIEGITKKLLIFSLNYAPYMSGAEIAVREISDRIDYLNYDLITARLDKKLASYERLGNINVYRVGWGNYFDKYIYLFLAFIKGMQLSKKNKYDVIWGVMASYAGLVAMLVHLFNSKIRYILSLHKGEGKKYFFKHTWFWHPLYRLIYKRADIIQATTSFHVERARGNGYRGEIKVIPNGVLVGAKYKYSDKELEKLKLTLGFDPADVVIGIKSGLTEGDGVAEAIKILSQLDDHYKMIIMLPHMAQKDYLGLIKELGLVKRIQFIDSDIQFDFIKYLHLCNIFLKLANRERLGTSLVEAMLTQTAIIASDVKGINDLIVDRQTGLLYKVGDSAGVVAGIKSLAKDKELYNKIVKNALEIVTREYDWESVAEEMKQIIIGK